MLARLRLLVVLVVVMAPNVWAIAGPHQLWPYDSGPMFAVIIDDDARMHRFRFILEPSQQPLDLKAFRLSDRSFSRHFFAHVYGSTDERFPDKHMVADTPARFTARMTAFFADVVAHLRKTKRLPAGTTAVRVDVERLRSHARKAPYDVHVVGRYDIATQRFVHTFAQTQPSQPGVEGAP
jgi:hypothetical protein